MFRSKKLSSDWMFQKPVKEIIHTRKDVNTGSKKDFTLKMVNRTHYQTVDENGESCVGVCVGGKIYLLII